MTYAESIARLFTLRYKEQLEELIGPTNEGVSEAVKHVTGYGTLKIFEILSDAQSLSRDQPIDTQVLRLLEETPQRGMKAFWNSLCSALRIGSILTRNGKKWKISMYLYTLN
jgi:hypothetical protein